jgi:hypothetical protein
LLADTLVEAGHLGGAVGFQVVEGELNFLVVFVERVDLPAAASPLRLMFFAVGVELELTAAEGDFLIAFRVVSG